MAFTINSLGSPAEPFSDRNVVIAGVDFALATRIRCAYSGTPRRALAQRPPPQTELLRHIHFLGEALPAPRSLCDLRVTTRNSTTNGQAARGGGGGGGKGGGRGRRESAIGLGRLAQDAIAPRRRRIAERREAAPSPPPGRISRASVMPPNVWKSSAWMTVSLSCSLLWTRDRHAPPRLSTSCRLVPALASDVTNVDPPVRRPGNGRGTAFAIRTDRNISGRSRQTAALP